MFQADQELMESDVLEEFPIAHLLNVQESLLGAIDVMKWFLDKFKHQSKTYQERLWYLEGNLEILNSVMERKVQNIFEPTIYAEICFN